MYSWAGQLYTNLTAVYQRIKEISAGLTGFSGIKNAYSGRKNFWITGCFFVHELLGNIFLPTNCTNGHEGYALRKMATGSVARIYTNAMSSLFTCPVA